MNELKYFIKNFIMDFIRTLPFLIALFITILAFGHYCVCDPCTINQVNLTNITNLTNFTIV